MKGKTKETQVSKPAKPTPTRAVVALFFRIGAFFNWGKPHYNLPLSPTPHILLQSTAIISAMHAWPTLYFSIARRSTDRSKTRHHTRACSQHFTPIHIE